MSKLSSRGKAKFAIEFDNKVSLSFIWGSMTYSDNSDEDWYSPAIIESTTVEVMVFGPDEFVDWFKDKYDNPAGYMPVNDIPRLMQRAKSFKPSAELSQQLPPTINQDKRGQNATEGDN